MSTNDMKETAKSNSFAFTLLNKRKLTLMVQACSISSVNLGTTPFPTRDKDLLIPSNKVEYNPVTLRVLCGQNLEEWLEVFKWIQDCKVTENAHNTLEEVGELTLLSRQNYPLLRFRYNGCFPMVLGDLQFAYVQDEQHLYFDVTLNYDTMDVENVATGETIIG